MPRMERYSVQVEFINSNSRKEPYVKNGMTRNQYGVAMKKLWENYILKLEREVRNEKGDHYLCFSALKKKGDETDGEYLRENLHGNRQGEDRETDQGSGIRAYQQGW